MRKPILLPLAAFLTAAAPAATAAPAVSEQVAPSDAQQAVALSGGKDDASAQEKRVCKLLPTSGTRLAKRACLTAKEWKQLEAELDQ